MEDRVKVVVLFRKYPEGDILAIFPEIPADYRGYECMVYQHVGQHGGGDCRGMMQATKPAKPSEYKALKRELESIGYDVEVRERITQAMHDKRMEEARRPTPEPRYEDPSQLKLFGSRRPALGDRYRGDPDEEETMQTAADAMRHTVRIVGEKRPDMAWILTDQDVWLPNPWYKGPPEPHPEMRDFD